MTGQVRHQDEVVITGMGVVSPIGTDIETFWSSLCDGHSGIRKLSRYDHDDPRCPFGGEVQDFDPACYVRKRKSLKLMSRDIQLACAAAELACRHAQLGGSSIQPARLGVIFGADNMGCEPSDLAEGYRRCMGGGTFDFGRWGSHGMNQLFPLWMLRFLPNMPACHIAIFQNAMGPTNAILLNEVSSLAAVAEAVGVIGRGAADAVVVGGTSSRIQPLVITACWHLGLSARYQEPQRACRPFDAHRDGHVLGEGAGALVLEKRSHAEARGAHGLARVLGCAQAFEPCKPHGRRSGDAARRAVRQVLKVARIKADEIGHVNADGMSTREEDRREAQAIYDTLGDVPVTAPKSLFGNLVAGTGAVEMVASVMALKYGLIPPTLNYESPDPDCPVNVVHGKPLRSQQPTALLLNHGQNGRSAAVLIAAADG